MIPYVRDITFEYGVCDHVFQGDALTIGVDGKDGHNGHSLK